MTAFGAILAIIGTLAIPIAVFGCVHFHARLERHFAIRARLKLLNETLSDGTDGDRFVTPRDFKVLHRGDIR